MQNILPIICFIAGFGMAWLLGRSAKSEAARALRERESQIAGLQSALSTHTAREADLQARLDSERRSAVEKLALLDETRQKLSDAFKALSADALARNNQAFLELARAALAQTQQAASGDLALRQQAVADLVAPVRKSLDQVDSRIQELENARAGAYATLAEQVRSL